MDNSVIPKVIDGGCGDKGFPRILEKRLFNLYKLGDRVHSDDEVTKETLEECFQFTQMLTYGLCETFHNLTQELRPENDIKLKKPALYHDVVNGKMELMLYLLCGVSVKAETQAARIDDDDVRH